MYYTASLAFFAIISAVACDVAHLGYNYEPPHQGAPSELTSEYVVTTTKPHKGYKYEAPLQGAPSALRAEYVSVHKPEEHIRPQVQPKPAKTHYEAEASNFEVSSVLNSNEAPNFIDTNSLSPEASNDVGTVYGSNGGYIY